MSEAVLRPPLSKSDAQRALVLAEALGVPLSRVVPEGEALPRDVTVLRGGLEALRAPVADIDCHDGGAPFRFLLTQAALRAGRVVRFTGTARLGARPHAPLVASLQAALGPQGLTIVEEGQPWPLVVRAPARVRGPVRFTVTGVESSQFASSLLLGAATVAQATGTPASVAVEGPLTSEGYLLLTRRWVERAGFPVTEADGAWVVHPALSPGRLEVPGDWSSLTYLLVLAWKAQAAVERVDFEAAHPDAEVVPLLESVGLTVHRQAPVRVTGHPRGGLAVDAQVCPDAVPTLAALAAVLPAESQVRRCGILRHKESDRLDAVQELLAKAGASSRLEGETLTIVPGRLHGFDFDARDDHRLAMAAAVLAFLGGVPLTLHGKAAVAKSFPGFWEEAAKVGLRVSEAPAPGPAGARGG